MWPKFFRCNENYNLAYLRIAMNPCTNRMKETTSRYMIFKFLKISNQENLKII